MLRLVNAFGLAALLAPWCDLAVVAFFSVAGFNGRSACSLVVGHEEDEGLQGPVCFSVSGVLCVGVRQQCLGSYPLHVFLLVCVHVLFSLMYEYK